MIVRSADNISVVGSSPAFYFLLIIFWSHSQKGLILKNPIVYPNDPRKIWDMNFQAWAEKHPNLLWLIFVLIYQLYLSKQKGSNDTLNRP